MPGVVALLKVTLVLGLAGAATLVLARASAAVRHLVWALALTSALVLPVLSVALPRWQLPVVTLRNGAAPMALDDTAGPAPLPSLTRIDAAGHPALFLVDTISSLASADYRHDEWGVDVSVGGAQKGLMLY